MREKISPSTTAYHSHLNLDVDCAGDVEGRQS